MLPQPFGGNGGSNSGGGVDWTKILGNLGGIISGAAGQGGKPYENYQNTMQNMINQGSAGFNPYIQAGHAAINPFRQSLNQFKDPQAYMRNILGGYQESPYAKFQTQEGLDAATNAASAMGMTGSGVHQKAAADYARNISSQDMQQYLQNALGIQGGYLSGLQGLMGLGMQGANGVAGLYQQGMNGMATAAQNQTQGQQQDWSSILGGALGLAGTAFGGPGGGMAGAAGGNFLGNLFNG